MGGVTIWRKATMAVAPGYRMPIAKVLDHDRQRGAGFCMLSGENFLAAAGMNVYRRNLRSRNSIFTASLAVTKESCMSWSETARTFSVDLLAHARAGWLEGTRAPWGASFSICPISSCSASDSYCQDHICY